MATTMALFALAGYAINWGEPFSFTDGISMWPSILLRWFTFFVVIAFFLRNTRIGSQFRPFEQACIPILPMS